MKTLGVKFQVVGVKEAQASLNSLRNGINSALNENKKAITSYRADVKRSWREWKVENFGNVAQKQNLVIRQEQRELKNRSTYSKLGTENRALVLEFRLAYKDFFSRLEELLEEIKPEKTGITDRISQLITTPLQFGFDALLFPFQSMVAGLFERMGEVQVQDFAEGFNKNLQRALGLSFEETGGDVGNIIGKSLYKVYQKSVDAVDDYVKGNLQFNLADTLIEAMSYSVKTLAKELPALVLRTHRRIQINKNAIPEARRAAGLRMVENNLPEATKKDIENNRSITLVYGGANTDKADIGKDYTARVMKPYLKGSAVIPITRQWTNSAVDSEFQGDIKNLIRMIASNPLFAQNFKGFISENGLDALPAAERNELVESLDLEGELDLSSIERIAEIVESLMGNKDFALGKALQATFKGYNPDDVLGAAEAIALMQQFPGKDLQIGGFSHGGYNALGTVDLLNRMGYTNVKGFSIGTPITGANATVNPDNFRAFMGDRDYYYNALTGLAGDEIDFPEFFEVGEKEGNLHSLQGYVRGDSVKGGLQEFLGDRVSIPSKDKYGKHDSAYGYAVGELGAETALIRTLLTYLGESQLGSVSASEGFTFSAEETLPGYIGNIKKLGRGLKDEDTKQFHTEYIDFLETLQQELEIAEQLAAIGKQYKPVESLKKAAKIFPQMESLTEKHSSQKLSDSELEAAQNEAKDKEKLVFFNRKVRQQKDNIERTFQAMLGRKFSKKDESKGIYSFYNPDEYEERAGNFEGMVNWLKNDVLGGASDAEISSAQPTLNLLDRITASIRATGSTGELDLETVRDAEKLLGIDLKEFDRLFKEFEKEGKSTVDVNRYKDEIRTFRRNREQILNESALPKDVASSLNSAREKITSVDTEVRPDENISLSTSELSAAFGEYLKEIIRKGTEYGTNVLTENARQIESGNIDEAEINRQFNRLNEEFKSAANEYRKAVAEGNSKLAVELSENLLFQSASLKRIYGELAEKIGDENTAKSLRGFSKYLTSVQTEITKGQPNLRGRVATGLSAQIASNPDLEASVREIDMGSDIRAGVEKIINRETGQEIGYQFVLGIQEGGQDAAEIRSPSRVWQWIGNMIKAGFEEGVTGIADFLVASMEQNADAARSAVQGVAESVSETAAQLADGGGLLDPLLETEGADEEVNNFFGNLISKVSEVFDDLKDRFPILGRVADFVTSIGGEVLQVLGIFSFGEALIQFSTDALATSMQLEGLERSIRAVSRSAADGADNIRFVREEAKKLSIDLVTAEEAYKRILGATRNTPLEGLQTQQIFSTLSTTAKNRGLDRDATSRLFLGFEQAIAKGEFKAEEVRGQLAEVLGDIQNLLATSVGVPTSQLGEMMEAGDLKVVEVMPKLIAQLNAQNAALADSSGTAAAAQTRLNNAILTYQDSFGRQLQPVQKLGLNTLAAALEVLRDRATEISKLVNGLVATVLINLALKLLATKIVTMALGDAIYRLGFALGAMLPKMLVFLKRFVLITAAIEVWSNVIDLSKHPLKSMQDEVEASTKRLSALEKAFKQTGDAAEEFGEKQPKQLQSEEGIDLSGAPGWVRAIAGGDRLNLDNLIRNRWNNFVKPGFRMTTQAQRKQNQFLVDAADINADTDRTLQFGTEARGVLDEIAILDKRARDLESQRQNILPGDAEGLKAALEKEREVQKQRDELLEKSAQYAESLQGQIQATENTLLQLDELDKTGGSEEEIKQRANARSALEERLDLLKDEKEAIDEINSRIPKFLSGIDRLLSNTDVQVRGFIANQEDDAIANRTETIKQALAEGWSDADLEVKLDDLSKTDLENRIGFISEKIAELETQLGSAYIAEGVAGLERAAKEQGLGDLTTEAIEKLLEEQRSSAETKAGNLLIALDEYEGMVATAQSELIDLVKTNRDRLRENSRTISDYFFRINQQIKEARLEGERLISELFYGDIKNRLRSAIAPGSNTFVNGVIDGIQTIIDQASQIAQKVFGDRAAELGFETEERTLVTEMQDFIRQVGGASEAVADFAKKLNGVWQDEGKENPNDKVEQRLNSAPSASSLPQSSKKKVSNSPYGILDQPGNIIDFGANTPMGLSPAQEIPETRELIEVKRQNLDLSKQITEQQREALALQVKQTIETSKRQIQQGLLESNRTVMGLETKIADFGVQYDYQSAENQAGQAIRSIRQQFNDTNIDLAAQVRNAEDAIANIKNLQSVSKKMIAEFEAAGTPETLASAKILRASLNELTAALPQLEGDLERIQALQADSARLEYTYTKFIEEQNKLKIEQEKLNKRSLLLTQQGTIAEARGTVEQRRRAKIAEEELRLELRINELKQQYKPGKFRDKAISLERRQSEINTDTINYQALFDELALEKELVDRSSEIDQKKAGFLSRFGFDLQADKLKKENAIAQENLRYKNELIEINKRHHDNAELLAENLQLAEELNGVNLDSIENEYKSLGKTIEDNFISATQGFFSKFVSEGLDFSGARERSELEERLRYAEELNQLENQHREEPGKLAHLKNRARELNEQKLDKIRGEFDLFGRTVDLARQAVIEFVKQLALMAAKQAAAKFASSILGNALGGGGDSGDSVAKAALSAFTADEGATVGDRKISDRNTSILRRTFPGIARAWSAEGKNPQLGVFHTGEELLSKKTGEAGRYQMLKRELGINPLGKILNYSDGGTITDVGSSILSGFNTSAPKINLAMLDGRRQAASNNKTINMHTTVVTPDADSFRLNADQRNQDLVERLRRGI